jgi:hypothetical protein
MSDYSELNQLDGFASMADQEEQPQYPPSPEEVEAQEHAARFEIPTAQVIESAISPLFQIFCPKWNVSQDEVSALSSAYGDLLDKYFPDGVTSRFSVEITAITCTAAVIVPRLGMPRKEVEQDEKGSTSDDEN